MKQIPDLLLKFIDQSGHSFLSVINIIGWIVMYKNINYETFKKP